MKNTPIMEETVDHSRFWTWERAARAAVFVQVVITILIAVYFAYVTGQQNRVLATQALASSRSNAQIIAEVRRDVDVHAHASAGRSCGIAKLLNYLANTSPLPRSKDQLTHIRVLVHNACAVVPIGGTTG